MSVGVPTTRAEKRKLSVQTARRACSMARRIRSLSRPSGSRSPDNVKPDAQEDQREAEQRREFLDASSECHDLCRSSNSVRSAAFRQTTTVDGGTRPSPRC